MNDPNHINLEEESVKEAVISVPINGREELVTPSEALSIINHISGVLMAYERSGGYNNYKRKYLDGV